MCGIQMAGDMAEKPSGPSAVDVIETMVKNFHEHDLTCNFVALERDPMQTTNAYGPFGSFWIFGPYGRLQGRSLGRNWISMPIGGQLPSEWHNASAIFYSFGSLADTCRLIVSCCVSVHHTPSVITFSTFSGWYLFESLFVAHCIQLFVTAHMQRETWAARVCYEFLVQAVKPRRGTALFWYNMAIDSKGALSLVLLRFRHPLRKTPWRTTAWTPIPRGQPGRFYWSSIHGGCPTRSEEKWAANIWPLNGLANNCNDLAFFALSVVLRCFSPVLGSWCRSSHITYHHGHADV